MVLYYGLPCFLWIIEYDSFDMFLYLEGSEKLEKIFLAFFHFGFMIYVEDVRNPQNTHKMNNLLALRTFLKQEKERKSSTEPSKIKKD